MPRLFLIALLFVSGICSAGESNVTGIVTSVTGDEYGIYLRLDSGKPSVCESAPDDAITVKPPYVGTIPVAAASLGQKVSIEAEYMPLQRACMAKVITLTSGKVNGPQRR